MDEPRLTRRASLVRLSGFLAVALGTGEGKPGASLVLRTFVVDASTCKPIKNAAVDIWQADAMGLYSHGAAARRWASPGTAPASTWRGSRWAFAAREQA